ncbi:phosphate ABC transporter [Mycoplasmopsis caviae]|uniref:Phosphate ABC transporter n=1 Tax=Mycoplasmopsis caviae TaxID=55603 RepID=A0A3P8K8P7_9BACT|nr:phosphate ABC transporter [Mycoplasmopsis caviae]UUD35474.1 phosphate ABC transporter [Mycoplasmopsis caviae]VDR41749.1 Uncharacterised protein [Mycoplasmopsis caviae]
MKKKLTFFSLMLPTIPLATLSASSCAYNTPVLSFKGSSNMLQFLMDISDHFGNKFEMNIVGGGSANGYSQLIQGRTYFASMSKDPRFGLNNVDKAKEKKEYLDNKLKTFLVAKERLAFVLKLPSSSLDLSSGSIDIKDLKTYFNKSNWKNILEAFGGQRQLNLGDLTHNSDPNLTKINITPFYKSGGLNFSGTAEAFVKQNPFSDIKPSEKAQKFLQDTVDEPKYDVHLANESSNEYWIAMKSHESAALGFLTLDFVMKNQADFENENCLILSYYDPNDNKYYSPLDFDNLNKYIWNIGLYLIMSLKGNYDRQLEFLYMLFNPETKNREKIKEIYQKNALTLPSEDEIIANFNIDNINKFKWPEIKDKVKADKID